MNKKKHWFFTVLLPQLATTHMATSAIFDKTSVAESKIYNELTPSSAFLYEKMDREGQELVFQLTQQECKNLNACKGLNACAQIGENHCAGHVNYKNNSPGPFPNSDLAIRVASKKMAEKRVEIGLARKCGVNLKLEN